MFNSPTPHSCPTYAPATQITPDSIDELPTQEIEFFTQESSNRTLFDSNSLQQDQKAENRNYYDQLFSSDSEDEEDENPLSSDMSISESDTTNNKHDATFRSSKTFCSTSSDMSISLSEFSSENNNSQSENLSENTTIPGTFMFSNLPKSIADKQTNGTDLHSCHTSMSSSSSFETHSSSDISSEASSTENSEASSTENWFKEKDVYGITELLNQSEIDDLLGINEIPRETPTQETLPRHEVDKIGSFNIRNKYDHDIAAFFMMQENLTFLALQEPYAATNSTSASWNSYKKLELESARITCYETHFKIILFDSWKWGGKIISPFRSEHQGRATSIAFGFGDNQKLGIVSIYASTQECSQYDKEDEISKSSSLNITAREMVKELYHKFPNICVIIMGDLQETVSTSDRDNIGIYRKDYTSKGILGNFLPTHSSIVREHNSDKNYITRFGEAGGRGIDHILFPKCMDSSVWIDSAKIERQEGARYFPSDHSYINCSINRKGQNNNEDSITKRKFDYRKICNIKLFTNTSKSKGPTLSFNNSQFKDCDSFRDQQKLYNQVQEITKDSGSLTSYYLDEIEKRLKFLYQELWQSGIAQKVDGQSNKLVVIKEKHAAELSHILRKFHIGIKDVMNHLDLVKDTNINASAGVRRNRLRKKPGFISTTIPLSIQSYVI